MYDEIAGDSQAWDSRGNLLAYRGSSWGYDGENRLAAVNLPNGTVTTSYDPAGRLQQTTGSPTAQFLYDGQQLIAEYNASGGALIARYVPGASSNETVVAYDSSSTKSWYHADALGSVIAASDSSGNAVTINQYGPYGEPGIVYAGRNQGRIRYTGLPMITEAGTTTGINQILYDYRARVYAPKLGRFLQTDPIGTQDDRNLYAYVGNDPINRTDPTGMFADSGDDTQQIAFQSCEPSALVTCTNPVSWAVYRNIMSKHLENVKDGKSKFAPWAGNYLAFHEAVGLALEGPYVTLAPGVRAYTQNLGFYVGTDRYTGQPTGVMTVIVQNLNSPDGFWSVSNAYPGPR